MSLYVCLDVFGMHMCMRIYVRMLFYSIVTSPKYDLDKLTVSDKGTYVHLNTDYPDISFAEY